MTRTCIACATPLDLGSGPLKVYCTIACREKVRRHRATARLEAAAGRPNAEGPAFGSLGVLSYDVSGRQQCHICGRWWESLAAHAQLAHGVPVAEYKEAFGLNNGQPLKSERVLRLQSVVGQRPQSCHNLRSPGPEVHDLSRAAMALGLRFQARLARRVPRKALCLRGHPRCPTPSGKRRWCPTCSHERHVRDRAVRHAIQRDGSLQTLGVD